LVMASKTNKITFLLFTFVIIIFCCPNFLAADEEELPTQILFSRIYGLDNEEAPPILLMEGVPNQVQANIGFKYLTFELDIYSDVPPSVYAEFVHCDINWNEDANNFINNSGFMRTSDFVWESSASSTSNYSHRGKLEFPNAQVKFKFSGNYKIKIFEYYGDGQPIVENRFFVVESVSEMQMYFNSTFYNPAYQVTNSAYNIEVNLQTEARIFNANLNNMVIYRNHRWSEPYVINELRDNNYQNIHKYEFPTMITGFSNSEKRFLIYEIPAENVYRVLDMSNSAQFPKGDYLVQMPFSDFIRNGNYLDYDNDGAMITKYISPYDDEYVYLEFVLDPAGIKSKEDVFVSGSFNNWNPNSDWLMHWDADSRTYRLQQWVRRARHNYLYGTGKLNIDTDKFENISFDLYEGNTVYSNHTLIAFAYYRNMENGGYDAIIGVVAGNPLESNWNR